MKILITGSSGSIGTRLSEKLLAKGIEIVGIDIKPNRWNEEINVRTIISDLCNPLQFVDNIDLIIHLAANARVYELVENPSLAIDNIKMLFNVLEYCKKYDKKLIFTSSREVYGNSDKTTYSESDLNIDNCESQYAASKIAGESLIHSYNRCYNIEFIIIRLSNIYGMYDDSNRVIPLFTKLSKLNKSLTIYGKEKYLDFTYIDDSIQGIMKCICKFEENKNNTFNISSGKGTSIIEVADLIKKFTGSDGKIIENSNRKGETVNFITNISKAKERLNYKPTIDIKEGLLRLINGKI